MISFAVGALVTVITYGVGLLLRFYGALPGFFDLYLSAFVVFASVRFLLTPLVGRSVGSDRAGKKKNNSEGGQSA